VENCARINEGAGTKISKEDHAFLLLLELVT
jgi:hypothetical protein